ncbi:type II secretion system F family protein [Amnibacterium flavum]|uniref:Type II secretion protein F n=1 Tax=Amnibacterium flavum TaxID=2173173 RepID=A0A2V1HUU0_9MICO|nr:type II secretion system F family protein [Amnibacterium flavum]PVZ93844.1 type II secretion protein F [Amnibacterium flavum]
MIFLLGIALAAGLLLTASPWLWPRTGATMERPIARPGRIRLLLDAAGLPRLPTSMFVAASVVVGALAGAVLLVVTAIPAAAALAAVGAGFVPALVLQSRRSRAVKAGRLAWPDVLDHLVGSVRSGVAMPEAVAQLATVGPPALRPAFSAFARSYAVTGSFGISVDELKHLLADPVADRIIETLRMAREVGGTELTTVLRGLAANLRAEGAMRAELEARQSWVSNAAKLGVAAPWIVLVLLSTRPEASTAYSSPTGVALIVVGAVVTVVAYRVMRALGRLPDEQRWFA